MAPLLGILLTLCGLTGTQGITTVSSAFHVPVKEGTTVSIPCLYEPKYRNHDKALCKGYTWARCNYVMKTKSVNSYSGDLYKISDDPDQGVFTVTIKSQEEGTQTYWCAVISDSGKVEKTYFQLSVSKVQPSLYVDTQEITGFEGDSIQIHCRYKKQNGEQIGWCRLDNCEGKQKNNVDGSQVTIDESKSDVFVVTMRDLSMKSSGWYICFQGQLNMPVHLTIALKPTTLPTSTSTHSDDTSEDVSIENIPSKEHEGQSSDLNYLLISLGILLFIILVAMLVWWMFHRQDKIKQATMTGSSETENEVVYSNVAPARSNTAARNMAKDVMNHRQNLDMDDNVAYSVIVIKPRR